jgi:hypothetical protein
MIAWNSLLELVIVGFRYFKTFRTSLSPNFIFKSELIFDLF